MFAFTPDQIEVRQDVPFFEDAKADFAPYYSAAKSGRSVQSAQNEISVELAKLGGGVTAFVQGKFVIDGQERHGYEIRFLYGGMQGVIRVAGLPFKADATKKKIDAVLVQALMVVRDWLKAAVTSRVFTPGSDALIGHLLIPGTDKTVADYIRSQGSLPQLSAGSMESRN
jgi:hypothetical protein